MKKLLISIIISIGFIAGCTIAGHVMNVYEYGDTDTTITNKKFINNITYTSDTTKTKKNLKTKKTK